MTHPIFVEVTRGDVVESRHRGTIAVVDASGRSVLEAGDVDRPIYPRSAVKPLQALPLVASGAADALGLVDAEIALACGSHGGEPLHVATAASMLRKAGRDPTDLACGVHWPLDEQAARNLAAANGHPSPLHNNCSGKHAGFLCLARHRGEEPAGYERPGHPTMRAVTETLAEMTGFPLDDSQAAVDGCSIPAFAMPLRSLALGFARLGTGTGVPTELAAATARTRAAIAATPVMLAGAGRFDTDLVAAAGTAGLCKCGAEGVAAAAVPHRGLGIAIKIDDGGMRAVEPVMAAMLVAFGPSSPAVQEFLVGRLRRPLLNWNGLTVGEIRVSTELSELIAVGRSTMP